MAYTLYNYLVRATMSAASGLPEDTIINDFAFHFAAELDGPAADTVTQWIDDFYNVGNGANEPIAGYLGEQIDRGATHLMAFYEITSGPLGAPVFEVPWLGPGNPAVGTNYPTEVAAVASFHATLVGQSEEVGATRPRARRRGRIYLGPLTTGSVQDATAASPVLSTALRDAMAFAMAELRDTSLSTWSVWSRADEILRPVVGGWTDNAFDTQRRRGTAATNRAVWGNP